MTQTVMLGHKTVLFARSKNAVFYYICKHFVVISTAGCNISWRRENISTFMKYLCVILMRQYGVFPCTQIHLFLAPRV
jgi:hypothetical protein